MSPRSSHFWRQKERHITGAPIWVDGGAVGIAMTLGIAKFPLSDGAQFWGPRIDFIVSTQLSAFDVSFSQRRKVKVSIDRHTRKGGFAVGF